MPEISGILETALYVEDVERSARFYEDVFGFRRLASDQRLCAMDVAGRDVLLLFRRGGSVGGVQAGGTTLPEHDASGRIHLAFAVPAAELQAWEEVLRRKGVAIESRKRCELGGTSIYFRDPDQHLLELATPGTWETY